jgi:hypothetical protein
MKKISILLGLLFAAFATFGQAKIASDGSVEPAGNFPALKDEHLKGSLRIVADTNARNSITAAFRKNGMFVQTLSPFTLWRLDSTNSPTWQAFTTGSTTTSLPWDSITGKPDLNNYVTVGTNQTITGVKTFTGNVNVLADVTGGATVTFNAAANGGNSWELGAWSSNNDIPSAFGFYNVTQNKTPMVLTAGKMQVINPFQVVWTIDDAGYADSGYPNAAIAWDSANRLQINNGTTNNYADLKLRNLFLNTVAQDDTLSQILVRDNSTGQLKFRSASTIITNISGKLNISDTASMLSPYLRSATASATYVPLTRTVNGLALSSNISLTTSNIAEGTGLYYTDARSRAAISLTTTGSSGAATYNNTTGGLNIPTYTLAGLGGEPSITAGTTAQYWRGDKTWQDFTTAARASFNAGTGITITSGTIATTITQYTDALARAALSFAAGSGGYNSSTGVITIPTNTNQLTNGAGFITGINSSMVTTALGYTPPQPNGTGASGTWGINISGSAAQWNGVGYSGSVIVGGNPAYVMAWDGSNWRPADPSSTQIFLGLGSYAYRSSGLAELSGATFTGNVFYSKSDGIYTRYTNTGNTSGFDIGLLNGTNAQAYIFNRANSDLVIGTNNSTALTIAPSGAATFSSSVTAASASISGNTTVGALYTNTFQMVNATSFSFNNASGTQLATLSHSSGTLALNYGLTVAGAATFSSTVTSNAGFSTAGEYEINPPSGDAVIRMRVAGVERATVRANASKWYVETAGVERFNISSGGAATFSSSVTANTLSTTSTADIGGFLTMWGALSYRPVYVAGQGGGHAVSVGGSGGDYGSVGYNVNYTGTTNTYNYRVSDYASFIRFQSGGVQFFTAPIGTSGAPMSPVNRYTMDVNGNNSWSGNGVFGGSVQINSRNYLYLGNTANTLYPSIRNMDADGIGIYTNAGSALLEASAASGVSTNGRAFSAGVGLFNGNVSINSPSTYAGLTINNSSTTGGGFVTAQQNGITRAIFGVSGAIEGNTSSDAGVFAETGGGIRFYTGGSAVARMTLSNSGALSGISASFSGRMNADDYEMGSWRILDWAGVTAQIGGINASNWQQIDFYTNGTLRGSFTNTQFSSSLPASFSGGTAMTSGWNRTLELNASFPSIVFNSASQRWAGLSYDFSSNFMLRVGATSNDIFGSGVTVFSANSTTGAITFNNTVTAPQFVASSSGNAVSITSTGTTGFAINVAGSAGGARDIFLAGQTGFSNGFTVQYNGSAMVYNMNNGNLTVGGSVTATSFFESSDLRQKNVHSTLNSSDGINAIQYTFLPTGKQKWGYGAQQVQSILPFAVNEGDDGFLKVDYNTVFTYKIAQLEARIAELEKQLKK